MPEEQIESGMPQAADLNTRVLGPNTNVDDNVVACDPAGHAPRETRSTPVLTSAPGLERYQPQIAIPKQQSAATDTQAHGAEMGEAALQLACLSPTAGEALPQCAAMRSFMAYNKSLDSGVEGPLDDGARVVQLTAEPASMASDGGVQQLEPAWVALATQVASEVSAADGGEQPAHALKEAGESDGQPVRGNWSTAWKVVRADSRRKQRWVRSGRHWKCHISGKNSHVTGK